MQLVMRVNRADQYLPIDSQNPAPLPTLFSALETFKVNPERVISVQTARYTQIRLINQNKVLSRSFSLEILNSIQESEHHWLVEEALETKSKALTEQMKTHHMRAVPFCGVAVPLHPL
jgi:hypothetical protein